MPKRAPIDLDRTVGSALQVDRYPRSGRHPPCERRRASGRRTDALMEAIANIACLDLYNMSFSTDHVISGLIRSPTGLRG